MAKPIDALAFSAHQVVRLTGLSMTQLRYWDRTKFFSPQHAKDYGFGGFSRVYSFRDVVGLYVIALLRKKYKFSLQELRPVGQYLQRYHETPWSGLALFVRGQEIIFRHPDEPATFLSARPAGEGILDTLGLERVAQHVERRVDRLRIRLRSQYGKISAQRFVMRNAPALEGTRIMTSAVWNFHEAGFDADSIIREYPRLTHRDVRAAIEFEEKRRQKKAG